MQKKYGKRKFQPACGVGSNQMLVKIHNNQFYRQTGTKVVEFKLKQIRVMLEIVKKIALLSKINMN